MLNLYYVNKYEGFDCFGCVWGDDKSGVFCFCENGVKVIVWELIFEKVDVVFFV